MSLAKRFPWWLVVLADVVTLALWSWLIVRFDLPDGLLRFLLAPCVLAPFFYGRRTYWLMLIAFVAASVWVASQVSDSFVTALVAIAVNGAVTLALVEGVRALTLTRAGAEEALYEERKRLVNILWGTGAGAWEWNVQTGETRFNDRWAEIIGYSLEEIAPVSIQTWERFSHPDDLARSNAALERCFSGETDYYECDCRMQHKDGHWVWVLDRGKVVSWTADGKPLWMAGTHLDITDRVNADKALRESEQNFHAFFETITDLIVVGALDGRILFTNSAVPRVLGYDATSLLGMQILDLHPPDIRDEASDILAAMFRGERESCPLPLSRRDGTLVPVETRIWMGRWNGQDCIFGLSKNLTSEQEAQQRFERLFHNNPTLMALSTVPDRRFFDVNNAFLSATGYTREEVIGQTADILGLFAHPEQQEVIAEQLQDQGHIVNVEVQIRCKDGTIREGLFWGEVIRSQEREYFLTVMIDVTKRKRAEAALRETVRELEDREHFLATLNDITQAALETSDLETMLRTLADRVGEVFQADGCYLTLWDESTQTSMAGAAYGAWCTDYRTLQPIPGETTMTASVIRAGHPLAIEDVYNTPYLSPRIAQLFPDRSLLGLPLIAAERKLGAVLIAYNETHVFTPLEIERGEQVARQIALAVAKSRLYQELQAYAGQLEERVRARTAELQAQYSQRDAILRSVGDAIVLTDSEWRILYVNPAFAALTGYPTDLVQGRALDSPEMLALLSPDERESAKEALGRILNTVKMPADLALRQPADSLAAGRGRVWQRDMVGRRKDGRQYDVALTITSVHDEAGQVSGFVLIYRDVSRAKDLERARDQFIANISHQFRTPLASLNANIYLLLRMDLAEKQRQRLQTMEAAVHWLIQLIQDTEEILILDSGKGIKVWAPVSLADIVKETLLRYQDPAQASGLTLAGAPLPTPLPFVKGDASRLRQALNKLVENAIAFTPAGGQVTISVQFITGAEGPQIAVSVEDTGPGITAEELSRLFERFFRGRLAESGHTVGTGLGLCIAQQIVRAHGGRITVESAVGQGSTFTLWLRAMVQHSEALPG